MDDSFSELPRRSTRYVADPLSLTTPLLSLSLPLSLSLSPSLSPLSAVVYCWSQGEHLNHNLHFTIQVCTHMLHTIKHKRVCRILIKGVTLQFPLSPLSHTLSLPPFLSLSLPPSVCVCVLAGDRKRKLSSGSGGGGGGGEDEGDEGWVRRGGRDRKVTFPKRYVLYNFQILVLLFSKEYILFFFVYIFFKYLEHVCTPFQVI